MFISSANTKPGLQFRSSRRILSLGLVYCFIFPYLSWAIDPLARPAGEVPSGRAAISEIRLPKNLGTITSSFAGSSRCVVLLQDLHCQYQVQKNISNIIHHLSSRHGLRLVGEEGAFGRVRPDWIRTFPLPDVREAVSDHFVRQGKLSGAEFAAITSPYDLRLEGIEDSGLYQASEKAVAAFLNQESLGLCQDLKDLLESLKPEIYRPRLRRFDALCGQFRTGRLSPERYAGHLLEYARHQGLAASCPELARLAGAGPSGDAEDLAAALQAAEQDLRERLYVSVDERVLDEHWQRLALIERLLNISASPEDVQAWRSRPRDFTAKAFLTFLRAQAPGTDPEELSDLQNLDAFVRQAADFYALADQRSLRLTDNMLARMQAGEERLAVMITGGFHTPDIQSELQRRHISYVTIRPNRPGLDAESPYFERLQNRQTALEKLLAQSQRSLALRTLLPDNGTLTPAQQVFGDEAELLMQTLAAAERPDQARIPAQDPRGRAVEVRVRKRFPDLQILAARLKNQARPIYAVASRQTVNLGQDQPLDRLHLAGWNIAFVTAPVADRLAHQERPGAGPAGLSWFGHLGGSPDAFRTWLRGALFAPEDELRLKWILHPVRYLFAHDNRRADGTWNYALLLPRALGIAGMYLAVGVFFFNPGLAALALNLAAALPAPAHLLPAVSGVISGALSLLAYPGTHHTYNFLVPWAQLQVPVYRKASVREVFKARQKREAEEREKARKEAALGEIHAAYGIAFDQILASGSKEAARLAQARESVRFLLAEEMGAANDDLVGQVLSGKFPTGLSETTRSIFEAYRQGAYPGRIQNLGYRVNALQLIKRDQPDLAPGLDYLLPVITGQQLATHIPAAHLARAAQGLLELTSRVGYDRYDKMDILFLADGSGYLFHESIRKAIAQAIKAKPPTYDSWCVELALKDPESVFARALRPGQFCPFQSEQKLLALSYHQGIMLPDVLPTPFKTIVIPTKNSAANPRQEDLERCLQSYISSLDQYHPGQKIALLVYDDSEGPYAEEIRAVAARFNGRVTYLGAKERDRYLADLAAQAGVQLDVKNLDHLKFRNFLSLYLQKPYISVDDDSTASSLRLDARAVRDLLPAPRTQPAAIGQNGTENPEAMLNHMSWHSGKFLLASTWAQDRRQNLREVLSDVLSAMNHVSRQRRAQGAQAVIIGSRALGDADEEARGVMQQYLQTFDPKTILDHRVMQVLKQPVPDEKWFDTLDDANGIVSFTTATGFDLPAHFPCPSNRPELRLEDYYICLLASESLPHYGKGNSGLALMHRQGGRTPQDLAAAVKWTYIGNQILLDILSRLILGLKEGKEAALQTPEDLGLAGLESFRQQADAAPGDYQTAGQDSDNLVPALLAFATRELLQEVRAWAQKLEARKPLWRWGEQNRVKPQLLRRLQEEFYLNTARPEDAFYKNLLAFVRQELKEEIAFLRVWKPLARVAAQQRKTQAALPMDLDRSGKDKSGQRALEDLVAAAMAPAASGSDANVSCGTICQSGHEGAWDALDMQLQRVFDQLREIYYLEVPAGAKTAARTRPLVPVEAALTEAEADLANTYAGHYPLKNNLAVQRLRDLIKTLPEYRSACQKTGAPIEVFFVQPPGGKALFWQSNPGASEKYYAAGHFNQAGTRIHVSLPLALEDARRLLAAEPQDLQAPGPLLSLEIARHDLIHILQGRHDPGLDLQLADLARQDESQETGPAFALLPGGSEAFGNACSRQLGRIFAELRKAYHQGLATHFKLIMQSLQVPIRQKLLETEFLQEFEADVANLFLRYLSLPHFGRLQLLRMAIRALPEYREARKKAGGKIEIFFLRPETRTQLFWANGEYAAYLVSRNGRRIYFSLPLTSVLHYQPTIQLSTSLPVRLAQEALQTILGRPTTVAEPELAVLAQEDRGRLELKPLPLREVALGPETLLETTEIQSWAEPLASVAALHQAIRSSGWHSLAVPINRLPQDLAGLMQAVGLSDSRGRRLSFLELLAKTTDELVFMPHAAIYSRQGRMTLEQSSVMEQISIFAQDYGQTLRPGRHVLAVETLYPSDALLTGDRMQLRNAWDMFLNLLEPKCHEVFIQLAAQGLISRKYVENDGEQHRLVLAFERACLVDLLRSLEAGELSRTGNPGLPPEIPAAEMRLRLAGLIQDVEASLRLVNLHLKHDVEDFSFPAPLLEEMLDRFNPAASPNVSCGTICQSGHEGSQQALDEQLQRVYAGLAGTYNRVPDFIKQEIRDKLKVELRDQIPANGVLTGPEADLSQSVLGYLTQEEFAALQKFRADIQKSPAYQQALARGKDIDILFVRPESGKELFWHGRDYAAGHFNQAGTRIHISLPLALADLQNQRTAAGKAGAKPLAGRIADHELKHILNQQHDPSLDAVMAEIAQRDQKRPPYEVKRTHHAAVPGGLRLDLAPIEQNLYPFIDLAELQAAVESNGWRSLEVKLEHLPEDLKLLWQTLPLTALGEKHTWWEFLKFGAQEVILAPYLMGYTMGGGKVLASLDEAFVSPDQPEDSRLPQNKVITVVSTHYPSDALYTGMRIGPRNLLEVSRFLARGAGKLAVHKLAGLGRLGPEYLRTAELERHSYLAERQFLLSLAAGLKSHTLEPDIMAWLGTPAEVEKSVESGIKETEQKIRQLNYQLKLPPQLLEWSQTTDQALRSELGPIPAPGPARIARPGSEAMLSGLNRLLEGIFLELRDAYNRLVSQDIKDYAQFCRLSPRQKIRDQEWVGELEADMANAFLGYMPLRYQPALQQLRNNIRSTPEYQRACEKLGSHIRIFFLRPGNTELFWAEGEPAAAHIRHDGSQVILPLPLALDALRSLQSANGLGWERSLVVRLACREFKRISDGVDDKSLDREVREIAKLDKPRLKGQLNHLDHLDLGPDRKVEIAPVSECVRPVNSVKVLNQNIQEAGYPSLALPAAKIPADLAGLLQAVGLPAPAGVRASLLDLLLQTTDEIIFTPHVMLYSAAGLRLEEDLIENELDALMRTYGQSLRPGRRVMVVETIYPSGALLTGERITFKDSWELLLSVLSLACNQALGQLLPAGQPAAKARERERTAIALRRQFLAELKQLVAKPKNKAIQKVLQKHRVQELGQFLDRMITVCELQIGNLNSELGLRPNDFSLPEAFARDLAALAAGHARDDNVSCGTICQSGHEGSREALDEQIHRVYADLTDVYNRLVPEAGKQALARHTGAQPRDKIQPGQDLTEYEADLALVSAGLVTTEDLAGLQRLRNRIKAQGVVRAWNLMKGKDSKIFFTPTESRTELFWVGKDYAAGHFNRAGTRIHISLPLALADAHFLLTAEPGEADGVQTMTEIIAKHEFIHITQNRHDAELDKDIKAISLQDRKRLKIPYPAIFTFHTLNQLRVEISPVVEYLQEIRHVPQLQSLLREKGWKSLAVPLPYLPAEIKRTLERLPVPGLDNSNFWEVLKFGHDEIVFCPLLMAYGTFGEKITYSLKNLIIDPHKLYDQQIRNGRRISFIPALLPSDAIVTGEKLQEKEAVDFILAISTAAGQKAVQQLVERNDLDPMYAERLEEFERAGYAVQRQVILQLISLLENHAPADQELIKKITAGAAPGVFVKNLRDIFLPAVNGYLMVYNQKLGRQPDDFDIDQEIMESLARNLHASRPSGAVSGTLQALTNKVRTLAGWEPLSAGDYGRKAWWIENLWVAVPVASVMAGAVLLASGGSSQAWDLLARAVLQPQLQSWVQILSLGAWAGIFLGSHAGGGTPRQNLARAGLAFLAIAGLHFLPLTLAGVYLAAFAVHRIINFNQDGQGRNSLQLKIERARQRLLRPRGSA